MWQRLLSAFALLTTLSACQSGVFQNLFKGQEWENYALADGVRCTAPEMVDGDVNTAGKMAFPERVVGKIVPGGFPDAEAVVTLPERKSIHKIVIRSDDLKTFSILSSTGVTESDWKNIKIFDKNTEKEIVIRTLVITDKIKIRARGIGLVTDFEEPLFSIDSRIEKFAGELDSGIVSDDLRQDFINNKAPFYDYTSVFCITPNSGWHIFTGRSNVSIMYSVSREEGKLNIKFASPVHMMTEPEIQEIRLYGFR